MNVMPVWVNLPYSLDKYYLLAYKLDFFNGE